MAITLDELLGRNTTNSVADKTAERFPSYDDFQTSRRSAQPQAHEQGAGYDYFAPRQNSQTRLTENVRQREFDRPYEAPRGNEYQSRDYAFYNNMQGRNQTAEPQYQNANRNDSFGNKRGESFAKPEFVTAEKKTSLYEFTATDCDRMAESELYQKLAHTSSNRRPVFASTANQTTDRLNSSSTQSIAKNSDQFAFANVAKQEVEVKCESTKKHARLNTKGKVLLSVYLAVIVVVAVLVIVNAGSLNRGTAKTPSSSLSNNSISTTL